MKLARMLLTLIALFSISPALPAQIQEPGVDAGSTQAVVGTNGWYISDVTITAASPVLANGKLLQAGERITISNEGEHNVEFASPGYDAVLGQSTATQIVKIDKTPPLVTMLDAFVRKDGVTVVSMAVSDPVSGPGSLELSKDYGSTWQTYSAQADNLVPEYIWALELAGDQPVILARAQDAAGNMSAIQTFTVTEP